MITLEIIHVLVESLRPHPSNARRHSRKQIKQLAKCIKLFGFLLPILIDKLGTIIAGHGRVEAAKLLGMNEVPAVRCEHLTDAQIRAYVIADNKLAENAEWDREMLGMEFQALTALNLDFDLEITGFDAPEIDILICQGESAGCSEEEIVPTPAPGMTVTSPGDHWILGAHRLVCLDATDESSYADLMQGEVAQMVFTDPPYNVPIDGHVSGLGKVRHREFRMASGEMSEPEFTDFLSRVFKFLEAHSADGAIHYIFMDWRHMLEVLTAGKSVYPELKNLCVWAKNNGGMGSFYRSQHELVFVFKAGKGSHINNVELGKHGRNRTNVWSYPGVNSFGGGRDESLAMHPTVKPIDLVADAILDSSKRKGIVLDPFAGSGTTLLAAEKTGRRARLMELDPAYVDVIIRRYQAQTGGKAFLADCGTSFDDLAAVLMDGPEKSDAA